VPPPATRRARRTRGTVPRCSSTPSSTTASHPRAPLGDSLDVFVRREDPERLIEEVRGDEPELAEYLRIEERELEAGGVN
jgi:hypothetical protein